MKKLNLCFAVICIIVSIFVIKTSMGFEDTIIGSDYTGPAFFPQATSGIMIFLAVALIIKSVFLMPKDNQSLNPSNLTKPAIGIAIVFIYILALEPIGFIVATTLLNLVLLLVFRVRKLFALSLYPVLLSIVVYMVFRKLLLIDLPQGILPF